MLENMHSELGLEAGLSPEDLHTRLEAIVAVYTRGGTLPEGASCMPLYEGRNRLYAIRLPHVESAFVIKCFARLPLWRRLYYSYLGTSKAARSWGNAVRLAALGFGTPPAVGYREERSRWGLIGASSFSCALLEGVERGIYPEVYGWRARAGFLEALAREVARLHEAGVEHLDLSPGNILYRYSRSGGFGFYLVDLNRMRFHTHPLDLEAAARNVARLFVAQSVGAEFARYYAEARLWSVEAVTEAISRAGDDFWLLRLHKLARRWTARHLGCSAVGFYGAMLRYLIARCLRRMLPKGAPLRARIFGYEAALYRRYLAGEDIRHALRHREGYDYTIHLRD